MPRKGSSRTYRCPPEHGHASVTCYRHGCGCEACCAAYAAAAVAYRKRVAYGRVTPKLDPGPSVAHIEQLRADGWTLNQIAAASGIHKTGLQRVLRGVAWVTPDTENRILSATVRPVKTEKGRVPAVGTRRRLQALVAQGWTITALAEQLGRDMRSVHALCFADGCSERTRTAVATLYTRMAGTQAPDGFARKRALTLAGKYGWVDSWAWGDVDLDDPDAAPLEVAADEPGWVVTELAHLHDLGESPAQAIAQLGFTPDALEKLAYRYHRRDLAAWVRQERKAA